MPSSISSFRPCPPAASFRAIALAAIGAVGLYAGLIALWSPAVRSGQDQESDIAIAVEHFLYDAPAETAIVGSSQAQRIPHSALGAKVANLALSGQTPLAGLGIIARSGRVPRRIYVETNNIGHPADAALVDAVFAEPGYTLKRYVKALRTTYQPANIAVSLLRRLARGRDETYYPRSDDRELHAALIAYQRDRLGTPPDPAVLAANIAATQRLAALLTAQGAELVFFEMPIDPALEEAPAVVASRQAILAAFPPGETCWNDPAVPAGLPSSDGIHLDSETAAAFWRRLSRTVCRRPPGAAPPR
ncbi:MAG TPA: hypothetical protein VG651_07375 [Stellaceae bacterium]|nr:hypothetical protein [Stellaceae bacterium]